MEEKSQAESLSHRLVVSPSDGPYPDWWKKDLVDKIDLALQIGFSPEDVYSWVACDLQAQNFNLSSDDIQRLYLSFTQEFADRDARRRHGPPGSARGSRVGVRVQETIKKPSGPTAQRRFNTALLDAESRLVNPNAEDVSPESGQWLGGILQGETLTLLHERWNHDNDRYALGAVVASDVSAAWADKAFLEATKKGIRIPLKGSGGKRRTSEEKKRSQDAERQQRHRDRIKKAGERLDDEIAHAQAAIMTSRLPDQNYRALREAAARRILEKAAKSTDLDKKRAAEKKLKQKSKA